MVTDVNSANRWVGTKFDIRNAANPASSSRLVATMARPVPRKAR